MEDFIYLTPVPQEEPINNFHILDQVDYMKSLEKKYRKIVLSDMMNVTKP